MNHKPILLFLSLFFISHVSHGQSDFGVVFWSEDRDLNWDDFRGSPLVDSTNSFYMDLYIESFSDNFYWSRGNGEIPKVYIYTNTSFVDEDIRSDDLLRYFNVYFDLAGLYAYKLANTMAEARKSEDDNIRNNRHIIKNGIVEEWRAESDRLTIETRYGAEIEKLIMWEQKVEDLLKNQTVPVYTLPEYALTFAAGLGMRNGLNEFDDFLENKLCGYFDFEFIKEPFSFNFGITGGGVTALRTFSKGEEEFEIDSDPNFINLFLQAGYQIINTRIFKLTPRAGIHFTNLYYPEEDDIDSSVWGFSYAAGLTADINFRTWRLNNYNASGFSKFGLRIGGFYFPTMIGKQNLTHAIFTAGLYYKLSSEK